MRNRKLSQNKIKKTNRAEHKIKRTEKEKRCISASDGRKPGSRTRLGKIKQEVQEFNQNEKKKTLAQSIFF